MKKCEKCGREVDEIYPCERCGKDYCANCIPFDTEWTKKLGELVGSCPACKIPIMKLIRKDN